MFLSRNKKTNVYPCKPQFYYIKVGFKGVKIISACFRYKGLLQQKPQTSERIRCIWNMIPTNRMVCNILRGYVNDLSLRCEHVSRNIRKRTIEIFAPSEDSDLPAYSRGPIKILTGRIWIAKDAKKAKKADLSLRWTYI